MIALDVQRGAEGDEGAQEPTSAANPGPEAGNNVIALPGRSGAVEDAEDAGGLVYDPWLFLPEGEYEVAYVHADKRRKHFGGRDKWFVYMRVVGEGVGHGEVLRFFLAVPPDPSKDRTKRGAQERALARLLRKRRAPVAKAKGLGPGWKIVSAYRTATGLRPPHHLARLHPRSFLSECVFRARVRTVVTDAKGVEFEENAGYSEIETLLERIAGTPPCLQRKPG